MEFFIFSLAVYAFIQFLVLSLWGHFYSQKQEDPSKWTVKYSTVFLLPFFKLSQKFKNDFATHVSDLYKKRLQSEKANSSKDTLSSGEGPDVEQMQKVLKIMPKRLVEFNQREIENLSLAHRYFHGEE